MKKTIPKRTRAPGAGRPKTDPATHKIMISARIDPEAKAIWDGMKGKGPWLESALKATQK